MLSNHSEAVSRARRRSGVGVLSKMLLWFSLYFVFYFRLLTHPKYGKTEYQAELCIYWGGGGRGGVLTRHYTSKYPGN